jgi:uncharacterized protein
MPRITIHVKPNAKTTEIVSRELGVWTIKLHAPATEGKANEELIRFLSEEFDVPKSCVEIVKGMASRVKVMEIKK